MSKALKNTVAIIIIIFISIGLGYVYEQVTVHFGKKAHPLMYEEIVEKYAHEYGVPKEIIYSVINTESNFKSDAVSPRGAVGLMQIMPDTFEWISGKMGEITSDGLLYDPYTNIKYGTFYLRYLFDRFNSWDIAFAAYNAGPTRISSWLDNPEYIKDNKVVYIPIEETRNYLKRVNKNIENYKKLYFDKEK